MRENDRLRYLLKNSARNEQESVLTDNQVLNLQEKLSLLEKKLVRVKPGELHLVHAELTKIISHLKGKVYPDQPRSKGILREPSVQPIPAPKPYYLLDGRYTIVKSEPLDPLKPKRRSRKAEPRRQSSPFQRFDPTRYILF